jgi:hypothetical protein
MPHDLELDLGDVLQSTDHLELVYDLFKVPSAV